jgi:hypothetical protein
MSWCCESVKGDDELPAADLSTLHRRCRLSSCTEKSASNGEGKALHQRSFRSLLSIFRTSTFIFSIDVLYLCISYMVVHLIYGRISHTWACTSASLPRACISYMGVHLTYGLASVHLIYGCASHIWACISNMVVHLIYGYVCISFRRELTYRRITHTHV